MDSIEKALDLADAARNQKSLSQARKKAQQALALDPGCVSAMLVLADYCEDEEEAENWYRKAIDQAKEAISGIVVEEPDYWQIPEARPWLFAREGLARFLRDCDRLEEAVEEFQGLRALNPNDNQGIRFPLLGSLLELNRDAEARELLDAYPDDSSAVWAYGSALLAFREQAREAEIDLAQFDEAWMRRQESRLDRGEALELPQTLRAVDKQLRAALEENHWGGIFLLNPEETLERTEPESVVVGGETEGLEAAQFLLTAFYSDLATMAWLHDVAMGWLIQNGREDDLAAFAREP